MSRDPAPVCRGVAFLDERFPGWEAQIDLDELDLNNTERCVLGQLWLAQHPRTRKRGMAYDRMCKVLGFRQDTEVDEAEIYGFCAPDIYEGYDYHDTEQRFDRLTAAWKRVIRRRLKARAA